MCTVDMTMIMEILGVQIGLSGVVPGRGKGMGPFLCFGKYSRYGGYGDWKRGARILKLRFGDGGLEVETWVRMEGVLQRVRLNEMRTYGHDLYPVDDGE